MTAPRALAVVVAAALAAPACGAGAGGSTAPRRPIALVLPAVDGGEVDLAALRGQVVVLHVFAVWSLEATGDVPQLTEAAARDGVEVVGLALDPEGYQVIAPWRRALGVRYLLTTADAAVRAGDSPLGALPVVPTTLVLDRRGVVVRRFDRALADGELARTLDEVLAAR